MKKYRIILKNEAEIEFTGRISFSVDSSGKRVSYISIDEVRRGTPNIVFLNTDEVIAIIESEI